VRAETADKTYDHLKGMFSVYNKVDLVFLRLVLVDVGVIFRRRDQHIVSQVATLNINNILNKNCSPPSGIHNKVRLFVCAPLH
jgi:hypothetical protein